MRLASFEDVHEAGVLEDDDLPIDVGVFDRLADRSEGDVFGNEVAEVALGVVPVGKTCQLAARRTHVMDVLPELFRFAQLDREVGDEGKRIEIDDAKCVAVIGAEQLELLRIGEDFQSVGSIR